MARRDPLHMALIAKLGFSPQHVNKLIGKREHERLLPRRLAMISLAQERNVKLRGLVTDEELAALRGIAGPAQPVQIAPMPPRRTTPNPAPGGKRDPRPATRARDGIDKIMVAYGRDRPNRIAIFQLLRAMGLDPIEWTTALAASGKAAPSIRETVEAAFRLAKAVVVLMTPDDLVLLRPSLRKVKEPEYEKTVIGQARPNVLFEAGMAFGLHPDKTVVVTVGPVKPLSDLSGLHVTGLDNEAASRQEFATKLRNAGCRVPTEDRIDWLSEGQFVIREDVELGMSEEEYGDTTAS